MLMSKRGTTTTCVCEIVIFATEIRLSLGRLLFFCFSAAAIAKGLINSKMRSKTKKKKKKHVGDNPVVLSER